MRKSRKLAAVSGALRHLRIMESALPCRQVTAINLRNE